jgi:hypothetical protein
MATRKYHRKPNTFRKARSKRQRGGNQDEKDTYLFDAIAHHRYDKVENALKKEANVNAEAGYIDDSDKLTVMGFSITQSDCPVRPRVVCLRALLHGRHWAVPSSPET